MQGSYLTSKNPLPMAWGCWQALGSRGSKCIAGWLANLCSNRETAVILKPVVSLRAISFRGKEETSPGQAEALASARKSIINSVDVVSLDWKNKEEEAKIAAFIKRQKQWGLERSKSQETCKEEILTPEVASSMMSLHSLISIMSLPWPNFQGQHYFIFLSWKRERGQAAY